MKNLYACEKCGAQYDDYEQCYKCESSHVSQGNEMGAQLQKFETWKQGDILPRTIGIASEGIWKHDENFDKSSYEYVFGLYEFKRLLTDKEVEEMKEEKRIADEEAERQFNEWREREEQRKAEKESAEKAAAETDELEEAGA